MTTGLMCFRSTLRRTAVLVSIAFMAAAFSQVAIAQDQDRNDDRDDPPSRVARLGHMEGPISFQPAGESEWVEAVRNRPMTTGDKLWSDRDSRAEVQLGSSTIDLAPNTGFSFLNLDDHTVQIQLSAGTINVRVFDLDRDDVYEIDTPNQAFTIHQRGRYRIESAENGDYSVVTIREGDGEAAGNGQTYTIHQGQRVTFRGTNSLNADFEQIGDSDPFDRWSYDRERRYDDSPTARYCSREVVGFEDLDDNGDWRPAPEYGYVWYPRVDPGWAPYHYGHWAWIDPWGWTWVDDARWGYAPFHYGRWVSIGGRWGWIPGPREVHPVYAPALVAFVGGVGVGVGGNVAWFPLGPREVYVPSYRVSPTYVNRVNVTNTTVNVTQVTNVYNTTIINNNTTINNVTYVNRNVQGAVTAVPQRAFATAQPVATSAVVVNQQQLARVQVTARAAVSPAPQAVLGAHADTSNRVAAPPAAVMNRQVIAKTAPPPPPPSFAARQQVLAQHPGVPVARQELQRMAPQAAATAPRVNVVAPANPAANQPAPRPGNPATANSPMNATQPGRPQPGVTPAPNQPGNRPGPAANRSFEPPVRDDRAPVAQPNNRPDFNQPNRPQPNQPQPNQPNPNNRPFQPPAARNDQPPATQPNRPEMSQPAPNNREMNRPSQPPARNEYPGAMQPNNRPQPQPENRPQPNPPQPNRQEMNRRQPRTESAPPPPNQPAPRPQNPPPSERQQVRPQENRPAPPPQPQSNKPQKQDDKHKPPQ